MKLHEYLATLTPPERIAFAKRAGMTDNYLAQIKCGARSPKVERCLLMITASDGALTLADLRPDMWGPEVLAAAESAAQVALELKDIRGKVDEETHRKLSAIAISQEREISDLLREAIEMFIREEIRKAHAGKVLLRILGNEGSAGDLSGKPPK